jgi:hypothetical protein
MRNAVAEPTGDLGIKVLKGFGVSGPRTSVPARELTDAEIFHYGFPHRGLEPEVAAWRAKNRKNLMRRARKVMLARKLGIPTFYGSLSLVIIRASGEVIDLGLASMAVVTTRGAEWIVDAFQNLQELEVMKYHGIGTGTNAEAVGDTILQTELTTQYSTDNTRATGSTTESTATIYRTVGTNTVDSAVTIAEHGIFSQAATGAEAAGNRLFDRSQFTGVALASSDSLQTTYDLTVNAGG